MRRARAPGSVLERADADRRSRNVRHGFGGHGKFLDLNTACNIVCNAVRFQVCPRSCHSGFFIHVSQSRFHTRHMSVAYLFVNDTPCKTKNVCRCFWTFPRPSISARGARTCSFIDFYESSFEVVIIITPYGVCANI